MYDAYEDDKFVHLLLERCTGGNLWCVEYPDLSLTSSSLHCGLRRTCALVADRSLQRDVLCRARRDIVEGHFSEAKAAEIVRTVLRTVAQCHSKNVAFRDIKPENFMYSTPEPGSPLKLSDFGLAVPFQEGQKFTERCGTIYYVAPEVCAAPQPRLRLSSFLAAARGLRGG